MSRTKYNVHLVMRQARQRRKRILTLIGRGWTQREIAELYNVSRQRMSQLVADAKRMA